MSFDDTVRPKVLSAIVAVSGIEKTQGSYDLENNFSAASRPHNQEAYVKPEAVRRNKRMFGALMGHLSLAKQRLEKDSSLIEKQDKLKVIATEKNQLEAKRLAHLQKINARKEKDKVPSFFSLHSC